MAHRRQPGDAAGSSVNTNAGDGVDFVSIGNSSGGP